MSQPYRPSHEIIVTDLGDELLLAVRALIDWYLARMERDRPERSEVKDIPIL